MSISFSNFVFTGIVYFPVTLVIGFISYKYFLIRKNDPLWRLLSVEFFLLTIITLSGALSGTIFTLNTEWITIMLIVSSFLLSFSNALLVYISIYCSNWKISPWIGFAFLLIFGFVVSFITMLTPLEPFVEDSGGVNWGMPLYLQFLRALIYILSVVPVSILMIFKYIRAVNSDDKKQFLFLTLFFIFTLLIVITDFIIEPLLKSPALLSELAILILAVISMISYLMINETAIRKIEKRYKDIILNLKEMIFVLDKDLNIIFTNPVVKEVMGNVEEIMNQPIYNIIHQNDRDLIENIFSQKNVNQNTRIEFRFVVDDDKVIWATTANHPVEIPEWESKSNAYLLACPEVTEIKELQQSLVQAKDKAEESNRLKSAFISNINHELRTPLNAIVGFSELIINEKDTEVRKDYQQIIETRSDHLLKLISNIIDISQIDADQLILNESDTDINELIYSAHSSGRSILKEKSKTELIELKTNCELEDGNCRIVCDSYRLKQVLNHLIDNAIKFTEKGEIEIGYRKQDNNLLEFFVADTGIGIPKNKHELIFTSFRQAEDDFLKTIDGTGIGLSLVQSLVTLMGGDVKISSIVGTGSTFSFTIPYQLAYTEPNEIQEKKSGLNYNWTGKTILIVDDDPAIRLLLRRYLDKTGVITIKAVDGREAIELIQSKTGVNLILMDLKMPNIDGFTAIREIKKIAPNIPIVVQSAFFLPEYEEQAFAEGCSAYIKKPIKQKSLLSVINSYI